MGVRGAGPLRRRLRGIARNLPGAVAVRAEELGAELLGRSQAIAPELTRNLIKSGKVTRVVSRGRAQVVVSYDTPYAVRQHEEHFQPGPLTSRKAATQDGPPGRRFLARPYESMRAGIIAALGRLPELVARRTR